MLYVVICVFLFIAEIGYFKLADTFNIIDKPNERSSHKRLTIRGGGIIFLLGVLAFFVTNHLQYPFFVVGLTAISAISFADDVHPQSNKLRISIHVAAVTLLMLQLHLFEYPWWALVLTFVLVIGIINAYNFMDGINGITTAYSFTVLAALYLINQELQIFNQQLVICLALANLVFAFFNFRAKAACFAGDVGSVSMAYALLFLTTSIIYHTSNVVFILLFAVYGIDTVLTLIHRISKGENIFKAHRQHLYQYLANELKWPHLLVSVVYMIVQSIISAGVWIFWKAPTAVQWRFAIIVLIVLAVAHIVAKFAILKAIKNPTASAVG